MPSPPDCAVVVVALAGGQALAGCLAGLAAQGARCHAILGEAMPAGPWRERFPGVRFSEMPQLTVPLRRERGVREAGAELVAILEDTSRPGEGWLQALAAAFRDPLVAAASGPVTIDPELPARAQALGCTEYARYHPSRIARLATGPESPDGTIPASRLPGNNLAYRRAALLEVLDGRGLLESQAHPALLARGHRLVLSPGLAVTYRAADPRGIALAARLHHGRLYAAARSSSWPLPKRLAWTAAAAALLPGVLCARSLAGMASALRPAAWPAAAAWICAMEIAWATGEAAGYLAGGGSSGERWR